MLGLKHLKYVEFEGALEHARHKTREVQEHVRDVRQKSTFGTKQLRQKSHKARDHVLHEAHRARRARRALRQESTYGALEQTCYFMCYTPKLLKYFTNLIVFAKY